MKTFTSSHGVEVRETAAWIEVGELAQRMDITKIAALREFFQAERDEELGRWRWPENPNVVVYPDADGPSRSVTIVFEETGGVVIGMRERFLASVADEGHESRKAARAYFEAHPESKPWHNAECGDSWYLEPFGIVYACVGDRNHSTGLWFTRANVYGAVENVQLTDPRITDARKVWPESD